MNRSTRGLLRAAAFAPAAVLFATAGGPAHADGIDGPLASILNGPLRTAAGQNLPLQAADLTHPQTMLPASADTPVVSADGLVSLAKGILAVSRARTGAQEAVARIGKGTVLDRVGAVRGIAFSGLAAKCVTSADGTIQGITSIDHGRLVGRVALPADPPANFRVRSAGLTLNKQVTDPSGGMTVAALSVKAPGGVTRDLGVVHCSPLNGRPDQRGSADALGGRVKGLVKGLVGQAPVVRPVLGGLTGAPTLPTTSTLPVLHTLPWPLPLGLPKPPVDPAAVLPGGVDSVPPAEAKDALPAGLGDMQAPSISGLSGVFGGLPGLPAAIPATLQKLPANG